MVATERSALARVIGLALTLAAVAGACGSTETERPTGSPADGLPSGGVQADVDALRPEGTRSADGVAVPAGARLVARPFPLREAYDPDHAGAAGGWQAVMVVTGDPVEVWRDLTGDLGIGDIATPEASCVVSRPMTGDEWAGRLQPAPPPNATARFLTEAPIAGEDRIDCDATVGGVSVALAVGGRRCGDPEYEQGGCRDRPVAHVAVQVDPRVGSATIADSLGTDEMRFDRFTASLPPNAEQPGLDAMPPVPSGPIERPTLPAASAGSRLPGPGDLLDDGIDPFLSGAGPSTYQAPVDRVPPDARSLDVTAVAGEEPGRSTVLVTECGD